jgi:hypothetical protein
MSLLPLLVAVSWSGASSDCTASDATLLKQRKLICNSLVQGFTPFCQNDWENVTASKDWPGQAIYMRNLLTTLASPTTCLNTSYAGDTARWLNESMANSSESGNFMWTWLVFQVQYYDMPRKPGDRIEAPDTLGRKCWAMAYLTQQWATFSNALLQNLAAAGLDITGFTSAYKNAMPLTIDICQKVICNCFKNASYDPSRSGNCKVDLDKFHYLGFDREGTSHGGDVKYNWHEHCS